jgi:formimidoylglutamate deiminase
MSVLVPELVLGPDGRTRAHAAVELDGARIARILDAADAPADAVRLPRRLLVPGLVNAHSHAFQRALRGRVERVDPAHPHDDFWTWREEMYAAAGALDPDSVRRASEACFREARAAGYTTVGEFHYIHHQPDGTPYEEPNELAHAVCAAARAAGIRLVLLQTAYARAGRGLPPSAGQRRFCDASPDRYLARVDELRAHVAGDPLITVGYAPHSVRALPRDWLEAIAQHAS